MTDSTSLIQDSVSMSDLRALPQKGPNLNLTSDQRTQIRSILQNAKNQNLSPSDVQSQINAILTPSQQSTFDSNVAALKSNGHSGHHHKGGGEGNTSTGTSSNSTTDAWGVTDDSSTDATVNGQSVADLQNQVLAGVSIQLQQLENQLGSLTPGTSFLAEPLSSKTD